MNDIDSMPPKCHDCPNWELAKPPYYCPDCEQDDKIGKWERHYSRPGVYADLYWWCSHCNHPISDQLAGLYYKYCPYCGAKMEQATDES